MEGTGRSRVEVPLEQGGWVVWLSIYCDCSPVTADRIHPLCLFMLARPLKHYPFGPADAARRPPLASASTHVKPAEALAAHRHGGRITPSGIMRRGTTHAGV